MAPTRYAAMASITLAFTACSPQPTPESPVVPAAATPAAAPPEGPAAAGDSSRPGCPIHFEAFDANSDHRVSAEEFQARPHVHPNSEAVFQSRDADRDGFLTANEFCSRWQGTTEGLHRRPGPGMGPGGDSGPGGGMGPAGGMGPGGGMGPDRGMGRGGGWRCEEHFARFDANADGSISETEFITPPHAHADPKAVFATRDQNHDGNLSKEEFCGPSSPPAKP
ncbi:MAG: hypothetical protein ABI895_11810 [Deltaproteobacteria bacterium]